MAVDSNALTLGQYALMSNDPRVTGFTNSLIQAGSIMARDIPFVTDNSLVVRGARWVGNLPTVDWTALNVEGAVTSGTPARWSEQAFILRNRIQIDKYLMNDKNQITNPMAAQVQAYSQAVAYEFNHRFINNTPSGEADAFVGIRERLDNTSVYGAPSANKIDASATFTTSVTAAQANAFLEKLDQALWSVGSPDGSGCVIYCNEVFLRRFHFAMRAMGTTGGLNTARDQFDRVVSMYKGARLQDVGYKADQTTRIITATETTGGVDGASTQTSVYVVNYSPGYFFGWQFAPMFVSAPFMTEGGAVTQVNIDWAGGIANQNHRSYARLYNINLG